jgi:hypothetical protein
MSKRCCSVIKKIILCVGTGWFLFNILQNLSCFMCHESVCSPTVRIIAFQAIDPGSTPGRRKRTFIFHIRKCNCHLKKKKKLVLVGKIVSTY